MPHASGCTDHRRLRSRAHRTSPPTAPSTRWRERNPRQTLSRANHAESRPTFEAVGAFCFLCAPSEPRKDRVFSQAPWPNRSSWVPCGNTSIRFGSFAARKTRRPISTGITPSCSPCRMRSGAVTERMLRSLSYLSVISKPIGSQKYVLRATSTVEVSGASSTTPATGLAVASRTAWPDPSDSP